MIRRSILGVMALAASTAAQPQSPRHFDFKGIKGEDHYEPHASEFASCSKYFNFNGCFFKDTQVAGAFAGPEAGWAPDGSLLLIRGSFSDYDFAKIDAGFRAKWGKPDTYAEQRAQNGYGATITISTAVWKFAEGEMTLIGPGFNGKGSFEYQSAARKAYMDNLNKPKADF